MTEKQSIETVAQAAHQFAAATDAHKSTFEEPAWSAFNAARVELLLTLGTHAGVWWEPDLALAFLRAADMALGNTDGLTISLEPGPVERAQRQRLRAAACFMVDQFKQDTYDEMTTHSSVEDFRALIQRLDRHDEWVASVTG
jgi:hypothetical protein